MDFMKGRDEERLYGLFRAAKLVRQFENCAHETCVVYEVEDGDGKVVFKENTATHLVLVRELKALFEKVFETDKDHKTWKRI